MNKLLLFLALAVGASAQMTGAGQIAIFGPASGGGGGGGTPGGLSGDWQFNNAGSFGGITPAGGWVDLFTTPSSANLGAWVTDETGGGGLLVFNSSPTIASPTLTGTTTVNTLNVTTLNATNYSFGTGIFTANLYNTSTTDDGIIMGATAPLSTFQSSQTPRIQVLGTGSSGTAGMGVARFANDSSGPGFWFGNSRGTTVGSYTISQSGDSLGTIFFEGSNGTGFSRGAYITATIDGTPGASNDMPGRVSTYVSPDGTSTPIERHRVQAAGVTAFYSASPAADDTYASAQAITDLNNSGGVTQWDVVYLNGSSQWVLADANGSGTYPARGIVTATVSTATATTVIRRGIVRNDAWSWTPGGTIYLSTTAGGLTQTAPSTSGDKVQAVGYALTADVADFDFDSTYVTVQ